MEQIKTIGVQALKKNLTAYLKEARDGVRILITDHEEWIAELRCPDMSVREESRPVSIEDNEVELFRSLSREARLALLEELEKV